MTPHERDRFASELASSAALGHVFPSGVSPTEGGTLVWRTCARCGGEVRMLKGRLTFSGRAYQQPCEGVPRALTPPDEELATPQRGQAAAGAPRSTNLREPRQPGLPFESTIRSAGGDAADAVTRRPQHSTQPTTNARPAVNGGAEPSARRRPRRSSGALSSRPVSAGG